MASATRAARAIAALALASALLAPTEAAALPRPGVLRASLLHSVVMTSLPDEATYDESPPWVKQVVGGLTSVVNAVVPPPKSLAERAAQRAAERAADTSPPVSPEELLDGLRADFLEREYLFTGDITPNLYDEECVFTDPTLSFKGLATFERNLAALDPILNALLGDRAVELFDARLDKASNCIECRWRMSGGINLPWRPRIELRGRTRYSYDAARQGRIVRYDEFWESSAAEQLLALLRPGAGPDSDTA